MVSEKTIVILITIAIILSAVSIAFTALTLNENSIPKIVVNKQNPIPDSDKGRVGLVILPPPDSGTR